MLLQIDVGVRTDCLPSVMASFLNVSFKVLNQVRHVNLFKVLEGSVRESVGRKPVSTTSIVPSSHLLTKKVLDVTPLRASGSPHRTQADTRIARLFVSSVLPRVVCRALQPAA